jgi:hypothetical protein
MPTPARDVIEVKLSAEAWADRAADLLSFDRQVHEAEDAACEQTRVRVVVVGASAVRKNADAQVSLRYQRLSPRLNSYSKNEVFAAIRARHRSLHPLGLALARADYDHAVDVWQWVMRLAPDAGIALQVAALFHDIERLQSEAEVRVEQHAPD